MLEDGIYIGSKGRACMCLAHTDAHVDQLIESLEKAVKAVKKVPAFAKSLS